MGRTEVLGKIDPELVRLMDTKGYSFTGKEWEKNYLEMRQLKLKLYRLKMKEGEHLAKHEKDFDQIIEKLTTLGVKMGEEDKTLMFLASVPDSFADGVDSVIHAKKMLTLAEAREELERIKAENVKTREGKEVSKKFLKWF